MEKIHQTVAIPHGGLGTQMDTRNTRKTQNKSPSHTVGSELIYAKATPRKKDVTIPHGGLGTEGSGQTRKFPQMSPSHTVGSEPQITTLTKIRHINHFVKVAPLSNEVNFPKSEIMQS